MRTNNTLGIAFFLKKTREYEGKAPIYARITVDGRRTELALKREFETNKWSSGKGKAKGSDDEVRALNTYLEQIRSRIVECYETLQLQRKLITSTAVKDLFCGVGEKEHSLLNVIDYHNEEMKTTLEWGTMKNYYTTRSYVELYLRTKYKTSDFFLSQLNYQFITGFEKFMKELKPKDPKKKLCGQNTIMKHIERMRKVVNLAIKNEWLIRDPFMKYKPVFIHKSREFLTADELATIESKSFSIDRIERAKDLFVFSCYTGLAYIDVFNLTPQNVSRGIDGEYWITTSRKKTDQPVKIPILPKAMDIIEKYKNHPAVISCGKLLPSFSNQWLNAYLKEIADLCGITKPLTFHIARHTFATTVTLTNGVPIETVSKLLGHTSIKTTQIYAKVIHQKISQDMKQLREKLSISVPKIVINQ